MVNPVGTGAYVAHMRYAGAYKSAYGSGAAGRASGAVNGSANAADQATGAVSVGKAGRASASGKVNPNESDVKAPGRMSAPSECQTCKERKYQDGSDEGDVSFKTAQHIDPNAASAEVRAHENMHVHNAYQSAAQDGGQVVRASVSIHTAVCPECGRVYVSGGNTQTMIKYTNESNPYSQNAKSSDAANGVVGMNFDQVA
ncbi:MAG: hypothetical protein K6E33_07865 [Lachnospiraceae bacterium]|nr:hypothetical protein [Lachnospiraceae bacterium]